MPRIAIYLKAITDIEHPGVSLLGVCSYDGPVPPESSSGLRPKPLFHGNFKFQPIAARIVFQKLVRLLYVNELKVSPLFLECNGEELLRRLAKQLADSLEAPASFVLPSEEVERIRSRVASLKGSELKLRKKKEIGEKLVLLFDWSTGTEPYVEFKNPELIDNFVVLLDGKVLSSIDDYIGLLERLGLSESQKLKREPQRTDVSIPIAELGPYLCQYRLLETGTNEARVALEVSRLLTDSNFNKTLAAPVRMLLASLESVENVKLFERGNLSADVKDQRKLSLKEAEALCRVYRASSIVANWLASEAISSPFVKLCATTRDDFLRGAEELADCEYRIPTRRLSGTDTAIAVCRLKAASSTSGNDEVRSETHYHCGDEVTIVLRGTVEFRLNSIGSHERLGAFDCIHFEAEHPHVVVNVGEGEAVFLSLRVLRLRSKSTRRQFWALVKAIGETIGSRLELEQGEVVGGREAMVWKGLVDWLYRTRKPEDRLWKNDTGVRDFEGMRRRLRGLKMYLLKKPRPSGGGRSFPKVVSDILNGSDQKCEISDLREACDFHQIPPALLFDPLIPAVQTLACIRYDADWLEAPGLLQSPGGAVYSMPCRKLLGGDIDILRLRLPAGCRCAENDHSGFEVLICLSGRAKVSFAPIEGVSEATGDVQEVELSALDVCHFSSEQKHTVSCMGEADVELMVIRLLDPDLLPLFSN